LTERGDIEAKIASQMDEVVSTIALQDRLRIWWKEKPLHYPATKLKRMAELETLGASGFDKSPATGVPAAGD